MASAAHRRSVAGERPQSKPAAGVKAAGKIFALRPPKIFPAPAGLGLDAGLRAPTMVSRGKAPSARSPRPARPPGAFPPYQFKFIFVGEAVGVVVARFSVCRSLFALSRCRNKGRLGGGRWAARRFSRRSRQTRKSGKVGGAVVNAGESLLLC